MTHSNSKMIHSRKISLSFYATLGIVYLLISSYFTLQNELWFYAAPLGLAALYLAMFQLENLIWVSVCLTPLSVGLEELGFGLGISLPSEPLFVLILLFLILRTLQSDSIPTRFFYHPITIILTLQIVWLLITSASSSMPEISFKYTAARIWFVGVMYFGLVMIFFKNPEKIKSFVWLYVIPLCFIIIYATIRLLQMGMEKEMAHFSMQPFYKDHAIYGACIALFIPIITVFTLSTNYSGNFRILNGTILAILCVGLVFSYTRAAWVSMVVAMAVFLILKFRIHFRYVLLGLCITAIMGINAYDSIMIDLSRNKTDSSDDLAEHVQSISNISTDASNLERINRWNSALRMFEDRPFTGFGPGTYSFQYAPYQHSSELTIISTNAGNLGNAHSEYLGPLAETGLPGALLMVSLLVLVFVRAVSLYKNIKDRETRNIMTGCFMGLITYFVHGVLNNYLDQDKAAVPFFALLAVITAIDMRFIPNQKKRT